MLDNLIEDDPNSQSPVRKPPGSNVEHASDVVLARTTVATQLVAHEAEETTSAVTVQPLAIGPPQSPASEIVESNLSVSVEEAPATMAAAAAPASPIPDTALSGSADTVPSADAVPSAETGVRVSENEEPGDTPIMTPLLLVGVTEVGERQVAVAKDAPDADDARELTKAAAGEAVEEEEEDNDEYVPVRTSHSSVPDEDPPRPSELSVRSELSVPASVVGELPGSEHVSPGDRRSLRNTMRQSFSASGSSGSLWESSEAELLSSADAAAHKYHELLTTERAYVADLRTMAMVYARPAEKLSFVRREVRRHPAVRSPCVTARGGGLVLASLHCTCPPSSHSPSLLALTLPPRTHPPASAAGRNVTPSSLTSRRSSSATRRCSRRCRRTATPWPSGPPPSSPSHPSSSSTPSTARRHITAVTAVTAVTVPLRRTLLQALRPLLPGASSSATERL